MKIKNPINLDTVKYFPLRNLSLKNVDRLKIVSPKTLNPQKILKAISQSALYVLNRGQTKTIKTSVCMHSINDTDI